ncbi:MAG TPA: slipin family protein [Acidimicrobiia bacterium]|nr:slipin family protein [Acidimicrobiia bacterium]
MCRGSNNVISLLILVATGVATGISATVEPASWWIPLVVGFVLALSPRQVLEWQRGVLLRLGRFRRTLKPGISWIVPGFETVVQKVDMRIRSTHFTAEDTLTKDTVPVNVDAVLFWVVVDAEKAILEVEHYLSTVSWAAQTTLRDVIGRAELVRMITDRATLDEELRDTIDAKTHDWGITVQSVEIRDVMIPRTLEDAMSRKAQADRELEARVILATGEQRIADEMHQAAQRYHDDPMALQLRAMNVTYESIKECNSLMVIPSGMGDSINPGVIGMIASGLGLERGNGKPDKVMTKRPEAS